MSDDEITKPENMVVDADQAVDELDELEEILCYGLEDIAVSTTSRRNPPQHYVVLILGDRPFRLKPDIAINVGAVLIERGFEIKHTTDPAYQVKP